MKPWLKAFRLRTLPLSFSNILLGSAIAFSMQNGSGFSNFHFNWGIFTLTLLTTLLLQILSNLANDYGDSKKGADNENRIGPARAIQSGEISAESMLRAIILLSILTLISGLALLYVSFRSDLNWTFVGFFLLGVAAIAAAIKYTVGKGAYGYSGLGDLFVFIFFGLVGVIGSFYLQSKEFYWIVILPAITMGCFSVAVLNLNNMRDIVNDKAVGKITLVVKLGSKNAKIYHGLLFVIAYGAFPIPFIILEKNWIFALLILPIAIIHALHLYKVYKVCDPKDFDPELKKVALTAFLFSVMFWISIVLQQKL
ncbi:MAG: 1,4-dihydroxy-2-naphthoate octaprenyltransferase [Crocinitomicaceae bacterium]|jgi:1,4-dihydroxy-2-naphthoate octaprenyltransferase|nr:1,4-dihydroxy-2-naphthoate octaprenyltransferase [Crocinitomicaceae bacterium]